MKFAESNSLPRLWEAGEYFLFRQAGGCLEIGQESDDPDKPDDLVHICTDDIPEFLTELARFVKATDGDMGLPGHNEKGMSG